MEEENSEGGLIGSLVAMSTRLSRNSKVLLQTFGIDEEGNSAQVAAARIQTRWRKRSLTGLTPPPPVSGWAWRRDP